MVRNFLLAKIFSCFILFAAKVAEHISAVAIALFFNALSNKVFEYTSALQSLMVQESGPVFFDDTGCAVGKINKRVVDSVAFLVQLRAQEYFGRDIQ